MLLIALERLARLVGQTAIDAAVLEGTHRGELAVEVVGDHLQAARDQGLTHHVQVLAERVDDLHAVLGREGLQAGIVVSLGQGIVHDLHETVGRQEIGDGVADRFGIRFRGGADGHLHVLRELDVVIAIDAEDLLHHVALAVHVHHIGRRGDERAAGALLEEIVAQPGQDVLHRVVADRLAGETLDAVVVQLDLLALDGVGIGLADLAHDLAAGALLDEQDGALEGVDGNLRIRAALVAERSVGLQGLALGGLADGGGIEVGALHEHVRGGLGHAAVLAAEHAGDAHRHPLVGDHHIAAAELALHAVERADDLALGGAAHHHVAADLAGVEGVQRLSELEEHEVGDIDDIVDRAQPDAHQMLLKPFRRRTDLDALDGDARVAGCAFAVAHLDLDALARAFAESVHRRLDQLAGTAVEPEPGVEVAGHAPVGGRVDAVGRDLILDHRLRAQVEIFLGRRADHGVRRKDHDSLVALADAEFVLGADHTEGLHAADLGFLDLEITGQHRAELGEEDLLAGGHVGRAAHHGQRLARAGIHGGDVEMVGVRVRLAGQHLGHHDPGESARDLFLLLHAVDFDADRGHRVRHFLRGQVALQILLEPIVTELHIFVLLSISNLPERKAAPRIPACRIP